MTTSPDIRFGPFRLMGPNGPLLRGDAEIKLPPKAVAVLWLLAREAGEVVSKSMLMDSVWPQAVVGEEALTFQIQVLRRALEDDPKDPKVIVTVHRVGFRLAAAGPSAAKLRDAKDHYFVGREQELGHLRTLFAKAREGQRQIVFITGEYGIGKTALLDEFVAMEANDSRKTLVGHGRCLEHSGAAEPYLPLLDALTHLIRRADGEKAIAVLRQMAPSWLLQIPGILDADDYARLRKQSAGIRKERMLREVVDALEQLAAVRPLILMIEDLHWSDHSTLDFLALLAQRQQAAQILVLCTFRPVDVIVSNHPVKSLKMNLLASKRASELSLGYLTTAESQVYLKQRLTGTPLSAHLFDRIYSRSAGHPLYLQQLSGYLMQSASAGSVSEHALDGEIPIGLRDLIELQLAWLTPTQQSMLEAASVCGAEFAAAAVSAASGLDADAVEICFEELATQLRFVEACGLAVWPDGTTSGKFRFRHILFQQTLLARQMVSRRVRFNRLIADRMEAAYGARAGDIANELAGHYEQARAYAKASNYCIHTARSALKRVAYEETALQVERGLRLLAEVPADAERSKIELSLRIIALAVYLWEHGHSAEIKQHVDAIQSLLPDVEDVAVLASTFSTLWTHHHFRSQFAEASHYALRIEQLGVTLNDPNFKFSGLVLQALSLNLAGSHREAERNIHVALDLLHAASGKITWLTDFDPVGVALIGKAATSWYLGYADQSLRLAYEVRDHYTQIGNPYNLCTAYGTVVTTILIFRREWETLLKTCDTSVALCQRYGHLDGLTLAQNHRLIALCNLGEAETALPALLVNLEARFKSRSLLGMPLEYAHAAEVCIALGRYPEARAALQQGLHIVRDCGLRAWEPDLLRLEGELMLAEHPRKLKVAEAALRTALDLAVEREAYGLALRSVLPLARVLQRQKRSREAFELLGGICDRLTEGFTTHDYLAAKKTMDALSAASS